MPQNKYPVSQLAGTIKQVLAESFKGEYWVYGELNGYKDRPGHVYPSICQRDESGTIIAKMDLCIFRNAHAHITGKLSGSPEGFTLEDGLEVCFRLKPDFYPPYGTLRCIVSDIDPMHTVEAAKRRRLEILQKLTDEGIIENNRIRPLPPVITRIGLITARNSAAERDFINELEKSKYAFRITIAYATMQGRNTEDSILKALSDIKNTNSRIEAICITRGGGDKTDLQWFDNEAIARRILTQDTPVLTGIGHEIDRCVLDDIAKESHKTPTALAASLVSRIGSFLHVMQLHATTLHETARERLHEHSGTLEHLPRTLQTAARQSSRHYHADLLHASTDMRENWHTRTRSHYLKLRSLLAAAVTRYRSRTAGSHQSLSSCIPHLARARMLAPSRINTLRTDTNGLKKGSIKILHNIKLNETLKQIHLKWKLAASHESHKLQQAAAVLRQADPARILQQGYTITTYADGSPLSAGLAPGTSIKTRTATRIITSTVTETHDA